MIFDGGSRRKLSCSACWCGLSWHPKRDSASPRTHQAGQKRAPLLRYIRINLPKTTRLLLIAVIAVIGAASAAVALSNHEPFLFATPALWGIYAAAVVFVAVGLLSAARIWTWGLIIALSSLLVYMGGLLGATRD